MMTYRHTPDMGEISGVGFDSGYENACQDMLEAGVNWLNEHPQTDVKVLIYENIYGVCKEGNDETKELSDAVCAAVPDCTGAMHQAVMTRLAFIAKNGWEKYCDELRARKLEEEKGWDDTKIGDLIDEEKKQTSDPNLP